MKRYLVATVMLTACHALLVAGCGNPGSDGGDCSLVGSWGATASGAMVNYTFKSDGTYSNVFNGTSGKSGMWTLNGTTFQIQDSSCTQFGSYMLGFASDCSSVTLSTISDSCNGRSQFYNGLQFTRQ